MNADQELQAVKQQLSKLKGETIYTVPQGKANHILGVDNKGLTVKTEKGTGTVRWHYLLEGYSELKKNITLNNTSKPKPFSHRGSFVMPALAKLSTVEWASKKPPRTLRYVADGQPPRLR